MRKNYWYSLMLGYLNVYTDKIVEVSTVRQWFRNFSCCDRDFNDMTCCAFKPQPEHCPNQFISVNWFKIDYAENIFQSRMASSMLWRKWAISSGADIQESDMQVLILPWLKYLASASCLCERKMLSSWKIALSRCIIVLPVPVINLISYIIRW